MNATFDHLAQDIRYALRGLRRKPLFAAVAVLSLALGIGANTALFSLVDDLLLRSLPVRDADRLVVVRQTVGFGTIRKPTPPFPPAVFDQTAATGLFSEMTGYRTLDRPAITIDGATLPDVRVEETSQGFFRDLGTSPAAGRNPQAGDGPVAVISHGLWRRRFGGDTAVLGRTLSVDGRTFPVVGVAPRDFPGLSIEIPTDVWIAPGRPAPFEMAARLKPGVTPERAEAELQAMFTRRAEETGEFPADMVRAEVIPAGRGLSAMRGQYERPLQALTILVALVLLLTCSNLGSLMMVRNASRRRELGVRIALGAGRGRLLLQYLVESAVLSVIGGLLALVVARWGVSLILATLPLASPPPGLIFAADARVLAFVAIVSAVSALLFGLAPAWRASRVDVGTTMRAGSTPSKAARGFGRWLVASQVALSVLLLVGAGLFLQTLRNLTRLDVGFNPDRLLQVSTDTRSYPRGQVEPVWQLAIARVSAVPGVASVSVVRNPLMRGAASIARYPIPGVEVPPGEMWDLFDVGPSFFETMGIRVLQGRAFIAADFAGERRTMVVNEAFAKRYFPGGDAVGRRIGEEPTMEIVGVVENSRLAGVRTEGGPAIYEAMPRRLDRFNVLEVRTAGDPAAVIAGVRDAVRSVNPRLFVDVKPMQNQMNESIAKERMVAAASALFALLGLVLASVGIFGVASYAVAQRTNELGIRMALGAGRSRVVAESLRDTMLVFGAGLGAGIAAAVIAVRVAASAISDLLFGLTPTDAATIVMAGLAMVAVAIAACVIPARHASTIDPLAAIRHE